MYIQHGSGSGSGSGFTLAVEWSTVGVSRSGATVKAWVSGHGTMGSWAHGFVGHANTGERGYQCKRLCTFGPPQALPIDIAEANRVDVGGTFQTSSRN